jgi:hypothetical protein
MADQMVQPKFIATGGQEMEIGLTRKPVSPWGGLALFAAFGEAIGLRRAVERALAGLSRTSPNALPGPKPCPMAPTHTGQKSKPGMNGDARG